VGPEREIAVGELSFSSNHLFSPDEVGLEKEFQVGSHSSLRPLTARDYLRYQKLSSTSCQYFKNFSARGADVEKFGDLSDEVVGPHSYHVPPFRR